MNGWEALLGRGHLGQPRQATEAEQKVERWLWVMVTEVKHRSKSIFARLLVNNVWLCYVLAFLATAVPLLLVYALFVGGCGFLRQYYSGIIDPRDKVFYVVAAIFLAFRFYGIYPDRYAKFLHVAIDEKNRRKLLRFRLEQFDGEFARYFPAKPSDL